MEDPLEEEMATHSSVLAWEIPGTPGGLQSTAYKESDPTRHSHKRRGQETPQSFSWGPEEGAPQVIWLQGDPPQEACAWPSVAGWPCGRPSFLVPGVSWGVVSITAGERSSGEC